MVARTLADFHSLEPDTLLPEARRLAKEPRLYLDAEYRLSIIPSDFSEVKWMKR